MDDIIFAEIDIEPAGRGNAALQNRGAAVPTAVPAAVPVAVPIIPRAPDPVREKFYEMRSLATKRPYPRNDSELFYRQARFMEDFTDDYEGEAKFNMYFPYYQRMGYDYLRTYFTWRARTRSGDMRPTSLSYIFLYIYELLSGIGVQNPVEGLSKLMEIWDKFSASNAAIERYMPAWLKDYHIFYEMPRTFSQFAGECGLKKYYSLSLLFDPKAEGSLELWNNVSGYDVTKSRFWRDGNEEIIVKCYDAVLAAIQAFCNDKGVRLEDMLVYSVSRRVPWQPFKNALFGSRAEQSDREIHISKYERYFCKNGQWTANLPIYYSSQKDFVGYIIKKTEACLREVTGYKYKLVAEMKPGSKPFRELQRTAAKRAQLDRVIEKAVTDFYRDMNRVVVEVDHRSLARIRDEALETQEQLIVEDGEIELPQPATPSPPDTPLTLSFADGWKALGKALSQEERKALEIIISGSGDIRSYAAEKGIMLEVLIDGLNEKASDCIGDSIAELADEVYVFDEYRDNLAEII